MDRYGLLVVLLLLFMIGFPQSNAVSIRKLVSNLDQNPNSTSNSNQDSPLAPPPPDVTKPNLTVVDPPKSKNSPNSDPSNVESNDLKDANNKTNPNTNGKQKADNRNQLKSFDIKLCNGNPTCSDQEKTMTACVQDFENGSNKLTLLVQNDQDIDVKVNISFGTSTNDNVTAFGVPSHKAEKVNITYSGNKSSKVILNAGNGDCELPITQPKTTPIENTKDSPNHIDSPAKPKDVNTPVDSPPKVNEQNDPSKTDPKNPKTDPIQPKNVNDHGADNSISENLLYQLQLYSQKIQPIYGLYFGFLIAIIIAGSWVFCSKKKRDDGGVRYQELEMGVPESSNAVEAETVEAWDQDWDDDDWDEDNAVRSPGGGIQKKSISANGLTSRGSKKDGWDANWDD